MGYPVLDATQGQRLFETRSRVGRLAESLEALLARLSPGKPAPDLEVVPDIDTVIFYFWERAERLGYSDPALFVEVVAEVVEPLLLAQLSRVLVELSKLNGKKSCSNGRTKIPE